MKLNQTIFLTKRIFLYTSGAILSFAVNILGFITLMRHHNNFFSLSLIVTGFILFYIMIERIFITTSKIDTLHWLTAIISTPAFVLIVQIWNHNLSETGLQKAYEQGEAALPHVFPMITLIVYIILCIYSHIISRSLEYMIKTIKMSAKNSGVEWDIAKKHRRNSVLLLILLVIIAALMVVGWILIRE